MIVPYFLSHVQIHVHLDDWLIFCNKFILFDYLDLHNANIFHCINLLYLIQVLMLAVTNCNVKNITDIAKGHIDLFNHLNPRFTDVLLNYHTVLFYINFNLYILTDEYELDL